LTRTEEDLLGTREVPKDAYWGIHTLRAIENYQISGRTINEAPELIRAFAQVKKACALANMQLKAMKPAKAEAIIEYRKKNGSFKTKEDLMKVRGIGKKLFESFEERIVTQ